MIQMQTLERARSASRAVDKPQFEGVITDLIVSGSSDRPRPQAFLVEQKSNWTLPTHFHLQHQFQLFVAGSGSLGKHPVEPLSVHYTTPHSGYGPLISGGEGIAYLTLRVMSDTGAWYLPESREHLKLRVKKQQAHGTPAARVSAQELQHLGAPTQEQLIARDDGGPGAWLVRVPPHQKLLAPRGDEQGGGRFYVITQGAVQIRDAVLPGLATIFVSSDDTLDMSSGPDGLEVVVLQFPGVALAEAS